MKKNGFTLIELLGVVTILAMLGMVIVPVISHILSDNKRELYDVQIRNIKSGASNFVSENVFSDELDLPDGGSLGIRLGKLKELGFVDKDIYNPSTKEKFSDNMLIMITNEKNGYTYVVCDDSVTCDNNMRIFGE